MTLKSTLIRSFCFTLILRRMAKPVTKMTKMRKASNATIASKPVTRLTIQVIGPGAAGTPSCILLLTDHIRYLFNCGEETQRNITDSSIYLSRIEHIFITHNSWKNVGGLTGLTRSLMGGGSTRVTLHGPDNVDRLVNANREYMDAQGMNFQVRHAAECGTVKDRVLTIEPVEIKSVYWKPPLVKVVRTGNNVVDGDKDFVKHSMKLTRVLKDMTRKANSQPEGTNTKSRATSMICYICKPCKLRVKLDIQKCLQLNVPRGPLLGQLVKGQDVTLDDGQVVKAEDVVTPDGTLDPILIVDCPSADFLTPLVSNERLALLKEQDNQPGIVVHMSPREIIQHENYQTWMNNFGESVKHLLISEGNHPDVLTSIYKHQSCLNLTHPGIFPLLPQQLNRQPLPMLSSSDRVVNAVAKLQYRCIPNTGFNNELCSGAVSTEDYLLDVVGFAEDGFQERRANTRKVLEEFASSRNLNQYCEQFGDYPEITFLGTGSAFPTKKRTVSSILVRLDPDRSILLDCGEGTVNQLRRHFGSKTDEILRSIHVVFMSHMHPDHTIGTFGLLLERGKAFEAAGIAMNENNVLLMSCPSAFSGLLQDFDFYIRDVDHLHAHPLHHQGLRRLQENKYNMPQQQDLLDRIRQRLGISRFAITKVEHTAHSYAVCFQQTNGPCIVYSGDTKPCQSLIELGRNCDLLIHEATVEDGHIREASFKRHSTVSQAIDVGRQMNARFVILTHFTQRFAVIPVLKSKLPDNVGLAFDNMRVKMKELPILSTLVPVLEQVFSQELNKSKEKSDKRTVLGIELTDASGKKLKLQEGLAS